MRLSLRFVVFLAAGVTVVTLAIAWTENVYRWAADLISDLVDIRPGASEVATVH